MKIKRNKNQTVIVQRRSIKGYVIAIIVLTLAVGGLIWGLVAAFNRGNEYQNRLYSIYESNYYELTDSGQNIELSLSKMLATNSDAKSAEYANSIYHQAEVATAALASIPFEPDEVTQVEKFLNQVGDWAKSYNLCIASGEDSDCYKEQIEDLYITMRNLNQRIAMRSSELRSGGFKDMASLKHYHLRNATSDSSENSDNQHSSVEYPELIYDGPFSDSTDAKCYKALQNQKEISVDGAIEKVKECLINSKLDADILKITQVGESDCPAKCYELEIDLSNGDTVLVSASKFGAQIVNLTRDKMIAKAMLSENEAKELAQKYAKEFGYDLKPVWYNASMGVAYVNLAPIIDDVVYYTDLVKIKIALDDGTLMGLEALGFCMNNCSRTIKPIISKSSAASMVSKKLLINGIRLALIPNTSSGEVLTYEISAEYKSLDYLIYISANDGREINILRVIDENQGAIVM